MIGYFVSKRINGWGYRHREKETAYGEKMGYIRRVSTQRYHAKDIRIFGLQDWLEDVWYSTLDLYRAFLAKRERVYIWTNIAELILTLLRNGIAYLYLIRITLEHNLPASEFLLYFSAVNGFTQWVTGIMEEFMNLTIHPGKKLAIVGLNGAGKTTLVKLVCGFLDPCEGKVLLNGEDIRQYNRRDYYKLFSSVFQDFSVLEGTIAENVAQQVDDIETDRVWDCLEKAGLSEKVHLLPNGLSTHIGRQVYEDGIEMSGGQIQRLMLARALYKNAPVIVLDEPTAALDPIAENDIYLKYSEMTHGRVSLFISHRLASTRFCDRILFMEQGRIVEEGTHEALLALGGGYAGLFEIQSQYYQEGGEGHGRE